MNRTLNDFDAAKKKLSIENSDLLRQLEEAESQVSQLSKIKISLTTQLEDTKRLADEESRERATLLGKFRNLEHDLDNIREQVEEEAEGKADLQRQLSKANAEAQLWRTKYESEGVARAEELEEAKRKLQARLAEAEETIESLNQKVIALEKTKQRLSTEVEDRSSNRGRPCDCYCQRCREETEGLRQDHWRMETQGRRSCRRARCQPEGVPQLQHRAVQTQR